jgi:polysaccharide pyruvyl transferase WcaK-like protein
MGKKVLFIGDLRTANNFGAIATTETLINKLLTFIDGDDIKFIDYRSLRNPTPEAGWKNPNNKSLKQKFRDITPKAIYKFYSRRDHYKRVDYVPFLYSQYDLYYKEMQAGLRLRYEAKLLEWADIVYINGEGNIVNGTDRYGKYRIGALYVLFMAWLAKVKYCKTVCLVNHTVDPANNDAWEIISHVYPLLDFVFLRERLSIDKLNEHGITNALFVPDALFMYRPNEKWEPSEIIKREIDFTKPYICIGDSSGIKNSYNKVKWDVKTVLMELINKLQELTPQVVFIDGYNEGNEDVNQIIKHLGIGRLCLNNCTYHDLYHVLSNSEIFISGRWHASILAVLSGTPILLWGSDSHKTRSLYDLLNYSYPFFEVSTLPIHLSEIVEATLDILQNRNDVKCDILNNVREHCSLAEENVNLLHTLYEK